MDERYFADILYWCKYHIHNVHKDLLATHYS